MRAAAVVVVLSPAASGHHSFDAVFDREQVVELSGTVTAVEWTNPHVWFFVAVGNEHGDAETWSFEMGGPNALIRRGWSHDSLRSGSRVTVRAARARDGSRRGAALAVTLGSGQRLFGAQSSAR